MTWRPRWLLAGVLLLLGVPRDAWAEDSDADGLDDAWERTWLGGIERSGGYGDPDADGLDNLGEQDAGTNPLDMDTDRDLLLDGEEVTLGTSPLDEDTDLDGLSDYAERVLYHTSPLRRDTDGGGSDDGTEVRQDRTDPRAAPDDLRDGDGDGLTFYVETHLLLTSDAEADTDGDGLEDGLEDANHDGVVAGDVDGDGRWSAEAGDETDPANADTDGDGVPDGWEILVLHTDPFAVDSDGDGLLDGEEFDAQLVAGLECLDPAEPDSDFDGLDDWREWRELDTEPCEPDSDLDGVLDAVEVDDGTDPRAPASHLADTDGDGLSDRWETTVSGTDPLDADPDGDGLDDGEEVFGLRDHAVTDPDDADSDDDGLLDGSEWGVLERGEPVGGPSPARFDSDGDGLSDGLELGLPEPEVSLRDRFATDLVHFQPDLEPATRTDPLRRDGDGDGLLDGEEDANANGRRDADETDPRRLDTDGDEMDDGWEVTFSDSKQCALPDSQRLDPLFDGDAELDPDGDGLTSLQEYRLGRFVDGEWQPHRSHPCVADTDEDGLLDGVEIGPDGSEITDPLAPDTDEDGLPDGLEDANANGVWDRGETHPRLADTDGDGLRDGDEDADRNGVVGASETDPRRPDTDGDGASDGLERQSLGTNPRAVDTDEDGLSDGLEVGIGASATPPTVTDPLRPDTDGDGLADGVEDADHDGARDPGETHPRRRDTDGDRLGDGDEVSLYGTDPLRGDTDRGGVRDGAEVLDDGSDPRWAWDDGVGDPDGDGLVTYDERTLGTDWLAFDTDRDTLGDGVEVGDVAAPRDSDGDGVLDALAWDSDGDGLADLEEAGDRDPRTPPVDSDGDGTPDYRDLDSDDGGVPDAIEAFVDGTDTHDRLDDGTFDRDGDGLINYVERDLGTDERRADTDDDRISDGDEVGLETERAPDTDLDGLIDALDDDSDGDTLPDLIEAGDASLTTAPVDTDGDGVPDFRDLDSDGGGVDDEVEVNVHGTDPRNPRDDGVGWLEEGGHVAGSGGCQQAGGADLGAWWGALLVALMAWRRRSARPSREAPPRPLPPRLSLGEGPASRAPFVVALAALLVPGLAAAAEHPDARETRVDANPFHLDPAGRGLLTLGSSTALGHLELQTGVVAQYVARPVVVLDGNDERLRSLVDDRVDLDVTAALGLGRRFEVGLLLPVTLGQSATLPGYNLGETDSFGLGQLMVYGKATLLSERRHPVGLSVSVPVFLPTATEGTWTGYDGVGVEPRLTVTGHVNWMRWGLGVGYLARPRVELFNVVNDDELRGRVGVGLAVPGEPWDLSAELIAYLPARDPFGLPDETSLEAVGGVRYRLGWVTLVAGGGAGLLGGMPSSDFRTFFGVSYTLGGRHADEDPDRDGLAGWLDDCPLEPEDADGFEDGDGCEDPDNDGDGFADAFDSCPREAEDFDGLADDDGCPEDDADADGLADADDRCPLEREDVDGFRDEDGCPDPDNDGDGLADVDDWCPRQPEDENGFADDDGCPDGGRYALFDGQNLYLAQQLVFDEGSTFLSPTSFPVLEEVLGILHTYPDLHLRIEGHTDGLGAPEVNRQLSRDRALIVWSWLVEHGAPEDRLEDRLEVVGLGEAEPIANNLSERGRQRNRRVELVVAEQ